MLSSSTSDSVPASGRDAGPSRPAVGMAAYAAVLVLCCAAVVAFQTPSDIVLDALFWIPLIAAANLSEITTLPELDLDSSLGSIVIVAAAVLFPPGAVVLFTFIGAVYWRELRGQASLVMAVFNRAMFALCGAAASGAALLVYAVTGGRTWQVLPAAVAAVAAFEVTNTVLLAIMLMVRRGRSRHVALREAANPFPRFALNAAVSALLSLLIVVLVRDVGRWSVLLLVIPFWLSHSAQRSARIAEDRAEELAARVHELEMLNGLSSRLLSVRTPAAVMSIATAALDDGPRQPPRHDEADEGDHRPEHRVPVPSTGPTELVLTGAGDQPRAVVEAVAALVGLTLTRLRVEAELAETERARTALTGRILEEATHERSRIAMAVHDDVLPLFAAAQMQIDNVEMLLEMDRRDQAMKTVDTATQGISDGIRALRDTLDALRESTLVPGTLAMGVRRLLADLQARTGVRARLDAPDPMPDVPFAVELLAYETIRGSLANVEKHAGASSVQVGFRIDEGRLVVLMRDDGRGFDPTTIGRHSHGLALMRQRAELARGALDVTARPGAGTTVRLEVPTW